MPAHSQTPLNLHDAKLIDGKALAAEFRQKLVRHVTMLKEKHITPGLAVILVGNNPASEVYVHNKGNQAREVGIVPFEFRMPADTTQRNLIARLENLNNDPKIHGILVQLPLPPHFEEEMILNTIHPDKDVDGFHIDNAGSLMTGIPGMIPCTPLGCMILLKKHLGSLEGKKALVIGRSNIVGKPMAHLLLKENCTVTIAHSKTVDLPAECAQADIIVAAVGIPEFIKGSWIKPGAVVIDVGINRITLPEGKTRLVGDVAFEEAKKVAGAITPVPGGVGPMTIACLLYNTIKAACIQRNVPIPKELLL